MSDSVDLTDLRSMTDGDKEMEIALFQEFFSSSENSMQTLAAQCTDGQNETWRSVAHALKGTSLNLGAKVLGDLCKKAQENPAASAADKKTLLDAIQAEYAKVKVFLEKVHG
jgi:HPt (histidine-containing phosphotransfer) domain-containing protein